MTASSDIIVDISIEVKKPPPCTDATGMPCCTSAFLYTPPIEFAERSRIAMSPYSSGRIPPLPLTSVRTSISSRMRAATYCASSSVLSGLSSSPPPRGSSISRSSGFGASPS